MKGPKGVGKSTSLYALAIEMATEKHHDSNKDHRRILYFSANILAMDQTTVLQYLDDCGYHCESNELYHRIVKNTSEKAVVCIDFGTLHMKTDMPTVTH